MNCIYYCDLTSQKQNGAMLQINESLSAQNKAFYVSSACMCNCVCEYVCVIKHLHSLMCINCSNISLLIMRGYSLLQDY